MSWVLGAGCWVLVSYGPWSIVHSRDKYTVRVRTGEFDFGVLVGAGRLEREACLAAEASCEGRLLRDFLIIN